jgi:predicted dehydrogenase
MTHPESAVRIGLIGAGRVADIHRIAIAEVTGAQLVALTDADAERARTKAEAWSVEHHPSVEALLADPRIDAVLVLTHLDSHLAIARQALEAGKHVLVEKPVGKDPGEIREVADLARARGLVAMPGHNYAYVPEYGRIQRLVRQGDLGKVRAVFVTYIIPHPEELASQYSGVLEEVMIHHTYLTTGVLGAPDRITAGTSTPGWKVHAAEDQAWMAWDYDDGACAQLFCSFAMEDVGHAPATFVVKVLGTEGTAAMDWRTAIFQRPLATLPYAVVPYEESYANEIAAFCTTIRGDAALRSTMADAAHAAAIIESAYRSARELRAITRVEGAW